MRYLYLSLVVALAGCASPVSLAPPSEFATSASVGPDILTTVERAKSACTSFDGKRATETGVAEIASVLRGGNFKKGEFEKSSEFNARLASRVSQAQQKIGKAGQGETFYFSVRIPADKLNYNADVGAMSIGPKGDGPLSRGLLDSRTGETHDLVVSSSRHAIGTYVGENSFGVKRTITRFDETRLAVTIANADSEYFGWPKDFKPLVYSLSTDKARKAKGNMVVLFAAKLRPPYYSVETSGFSPTINIPRDITTNTEIIHMDIECSVIFNRAESTVVAELPVR